MNALDRAIEHFGGLRNGGVIKLADAIGVSQSCVSNWRIRGSVPPKQCRKIEEATDGVVSRYELDPDTFGDPPVKVA